MAMIGKLLVLGIMALAVFFVFASMFSHAVDKGNWSNVSDTQLFNKTQNYADYMQNQSNTMRTGLQSQSGSTNNQLGPDMIINLLFNGVSTTVMSFFSFLDILISLIFDLGNSIGIPAFFLGLASLLIMYKIVAGVIRAIRVGEI